LGRGTALGTDRPALPDAAQYIFYNQLYVKATGGADRQPVSFPDYGDVRGGSGWGRGLEEAQALIISSKRFPQGI